MTTIVTRIGKGSPLTTVEVDANFTNLNTDKAEVNSPTLTGTPAAPTAAIGTNTTQIATTEYVISNASNTTPVMSGVAAIGVSTRHARADHVHPTDTSRAPVASPTFTGTVTIPSGAAIAGYAPLANPTFTGTVSGITKAMVGLGNADNTSDAAKPVSTATQTALNLKANLASPTFTGTITAPTIVASGQITTTSDRITIGQTSAAPAYLLLRSSGNAAYDVLLQSTGGTGTVNNGAFAVSAASATFNCPITSTGDITAFSDSRLKLNIATIENALERVLSWRGVTFTRLFDGMPSRGVVAQEVQITAPEIVRVHDDGMLSVNYGAMIGDVIEAIRELKIQIDALKG